MLDLNKLNENLKFPKSDKFNVKYKELFEQAMKIKKTRNLIIHQTNVDEPREDWENVWHTVHFELMESLLPELSRAIMKGIRKSNFERRVRKKTDSTRQSTNLTSCQKRIPLKNFQWRRRNVVEANNAMKGCFSFPPQWLIYFSRISDQIHREI